MEEIEELADAFRDRLITQEQLQLALRRTDKLLSLIYKGAFTRLQNIIEEYEKNRSLCNPGESRKSIMQVLDAVKSQETKSAHSVQMPRCKQRGIKLAAPRSSGIFNPQPQKLCPPNQNSLYTVISIFLPVLW